MARPKPCVLFAQSFLHPNLAEYVDEVRFTEPVVISACEVLELHTSSICPTLSLSGVSFPQSFALEIFVRIGGEARFKRLCPAFLYSPSASSVLEVQAAVTDHLVIRGSYRALSLVVYGNSVKELGQFNFDHEIDNTLSDAIISPETVFKREDLPEALQDDDRNHHYKCFPLLRNFKLISEDAEQSEIMRHLLTLAVQIVKSDLEHIVTQRVFEILLSAASAVLSEHGIENGFPQWPTLFRNPGESQKKVKLALKQARDQMQLLHSQQVCDVMLDQTSENLLSSSLILEEVFDWIQKSFHLSSNVDLELPMEEYLIGGLAAAQLLCTDAHWCFQLVASGGLHLLMGVLQYTSSESSATLLLVLGALKCACQHAFACEALLGWWPVHILPAEQKPSASFGYCSVLRTLLKTKRQNVSQLACEVLHHINGYQIASEFQCEVESLLEAPDMKNQPEHPEHILNKLSMSLKGIRKFLLPKDFPQDWSPSQMAHWFSLDGDDNVANLPPNAMFSWICASKYSFALKDLNAHILSIMQERRFLPSLAALLSLPWMRTATVNSEDSFLDFIGNTEALLLSLASSRSGLLFLASDNDAATAIVTALVGIEEFHNDNFVDLRYAQSLTSAGFLCQTQDIGRMLMTNLSVLATADRLIETPQLSENFLWSLWELSVFSRSETGRQALSLISHFPEVFLFLVEALQSDSRSSTNDSKDVRALNRAILHSAAEVIQVILKDPITGSLAAWVPHALSLQKALQYCSPTTIDIAVGSQGLSSGSKDALCARLLDWVDAAVVFHKKGPVGLLRYAAALVVGSVTSVAVGGLPSSDSVELDSTLGESAVNTELPTVNTLLGRGAMLGASGTVLPDTAVIQLTVSMHILSAICCHPGMAAALYGEGAMSVLHIVLEYGAGVLQSSTVDYDYMVEEDGEGDAITEMVLEQEREQALLGLLLPTILLLLSMLKRLQLTGEEYRNTRLVDILLQLHRCVCSRLVSRLPQASGMLVLASVSRMLVSALAFWPAFGWIPALFPKLLGLNLSSLNQSTNFPLEPKEALSLLWILGDLLPKESPQLCTNKIMEMDISRSLAVGTLLGLKCMDFVDWHCQTPASEKLFQAIGLHMDHIALTVLYLSSTVSTLLQVLLVKFIIRVACQSHDYAATLMQPLLTFIRENTVTEIFASEHDQFRVEQCVEVLKELTKHPVTKKVLLREGIVQVLLPTTRGRNMIPRIDTKVLNPYPRLTCLIFEILESLCDPNISLSSKSPLNRRLAMDCPGFSDYCSIVAWLYSYVLCTPLGRELHLSVELLCKIVSHQLGRAAFASVAMSLKRTSGAATFQSEMPGTDGMDRMDITDIQDAGYPITDGTGSFVPFCKRLLAALTESSDTELALSVLQQLCLTAIQLSAAGRSACGMGALQLLFEMDNMETEEILSSLIEHLQSKSESNLQDGPGQVRKQNYVNTIKLVSTLLRLLNNLPAMMFLEKKVKSVADALGSLTEEDAFLEKMVISQWRTLPHLFYEAEEDINTEWNARCVEEIDSTLEDMLKDRYSWECTFDISEKAAAPSMTGKRKTINAIEGGNKKHNTESATGSLGSDLVSSVNGNLTGRGAGTVSTASTSTRRDTFRQRKPNTSRPPSMHVDDYVARERGNEIGASVSGNMNQRSSLGGGRPPSIHVDEFMARQRERQQIVGAPAVVEVQLNPSPVPPQTETAKVESSSTSGRAKPILPDEDLQDVDIELDGVPDTDDLLSLPGTEFHVSEGERGNVLITANLSKSNLEVHLSPGNEKQVSAQISRSTDNNMKKKIEASPQRAVVQTNGDANLMKSNAPETSPTPFRSKLQTSQTVEITTLSVSLQRQESARLGFTQNTDNRAGSHECHKAHSQFPAAPALPPPLPPPPPLPAGVVPEKYDHSPGGSKMPQIIPQTSMVAAPPPPRPSGSNQSSMPPMGRIDQVHMRPNTPVSYGPVPVSHVSNPQVGPGGPFPIAALPPWQNVQVTNEDAGATNMGRVAPPLPPTPPPFSSSQNYVMQGPLPTSNVLGTPPFQTMGRVPPDATSVHTLPLNMDDKRFGSFTSPPLPQGPTMVSMFQPPLPPGRPNMPQQGTLVSGSPMQQHQQFHPSPQIIQPSPPVAYSGQVTAQPHPFQQPIHQAPPVVQASHQQDSGNLLQQILASPEAIQDLLKDQSKLQSLLEQHPKLISLLQEKMGQG